MSLPIFRLLHSTFPLLRKPIADGSRYFGGIDVQFNLVRGNRESIRREVEALMANFHAPEGRYIASPSNSIMPETPIENVWSLFEAIREFGNQHRRRSILAGTASAGHKIGYDT